MPKLATVIAGLNELWPEHHAEDWDRVGLVSGSKSQEVSKVLVSVDLTDAVIDEAVVSGVQLILTHHPVLLKAIGTVAEETLKGSLLTKLIKNNIACYSAHTNADVQEDGASRLMAEAFGLVNVKPLVATDHGFGHGAVGSLPNSQPLEAFASKVASVLSVTARGVSFAGNPEQPISRVALCSGAGDGFLANAIASDADVYVTSDLRHHPTLDTISTGRDELAPLTLIDVSHFAAERLWAKSAVLRISNELGLEALLSKVNTDPWTGQVQ